MEIRVVLIICLHLVHSLALGLVVGCWNLFSVFVLLDRVDVFLNGIIQANPCQVHTNGLNRSDSDTFMSITTQGSVKTFSPQESEDWSCSTGISCIVNML